VSEAAGIDWGQVDVAVSPAGQAPGVRMAGFRHHGDASIDIAMIPHPAVTVLVDLTDHGMVYDVDAGARSGSVVVGLSPGPVRVAAPGPGEVLQIRLSPIAAVAMLGDPQVVGGAVTPLVDLWGHHSEIFAEQIRAFPSWEERFAFMSRALSDRAALGLRAAPEIAYAWTQTARHRGRVRIDTLAAATGWSRQRLWSRFRAQIGLSPKRAAELVRFDHAARLLSAGRAPADVAHLAGYADQSHLHRQVKALAQTTPSAVATAPWLGIDDIAWPTPGLRA
jgi:AraC-like DNA-binding protein